MADPTFSIARDAFVELAGEPGDRPAVVRMTAPLDVETTPLAAYASLTSCDATTDERDRNAFLFERTERTATDVLAQSMGEPADRHPRYSAVGYDPAGVVTVEAGEIDIDGLVPGAPPEQVDGDVLDALRASLPDVRLANPPDRPRRPFDGGLVGFLAYDAVYDLWLEEVGVERPESAGPDGQFLLVTKTLAFDHHDGTISLVCTPVLEAGDDPGATYDELRREAGRVAAILSAADEPTVGDVVRREETAGSRADYEAAVGRATERVFDGEVYQCVVSRSHEVTGEVDPLALYASLRSIEPAPYTYLLAHGERSVVGASPETLVSVRDGRVAVNPIAGTCDRGAGPVEDRRLAGELLADDKERAEHAMLVDLARNDVRRVATPGTVRVEDFMCVRAYSRVQHIESTVTGRLSDDADAFDATRAAFPAGTLTGAPKVRAMELVDEFESHPRGLYGGGVGYYSWSGEADLAIAIRTATIEHAPGGDRLTARAGAGIVADSDPGAEYEETEAKLDGLLTALDRAAVDGSSTAASTRTPGADR